MLIRNITDLIGASLALFLGLILKALFPHLLRRLTVKGFKASRVTIHGDIMVPREIVNVRAH